MKRNMLNIKMLSVIVALSLFLVEVFPLAAMDYTIGLPVKLKLLETIRSGRTRRGELIRFAVAEEVTDENGAVLIPKGAKAFGTVTNSRSAGMFGRRGALDFSIDYTYSTENKKVKLRACKERRGGGSKGATIAATVLVTPLAFLFKGSNITVREGTELTAYLDENITANTVLRPKSRLQQLISNIKNKTYDNDTYNVNKNKKRIKLFNGDLYVGTIISETDDQYILDTSIGKVNIIKAEVELVQTIKEQ